MIFSFREEDIKIIRDFESKIKRQDITEKDFEKKFEHEIVDKTLNIKCTEYRDKKIEALLTEFIEMMEAIENDQLKGLKTQTQIIEDAKIKAQNAIVFYINTFIPLYKQAYAKGLKGFKVAGFKYDYNAFLEEIVIKGFDKVIEEMSKTIEEPNNIEFDYDYFFEYLREDILKGHYLKINSVLGEKKLNKAISEILKKSAHIIVNANNVNYSVMHNNNLPVHYGRYIPITADVTRHKQAIEPLGNEIVITSEENEYIYKLSNADSIKGLNRINTHKLFIVCVAEFAKINTNSSNINYTVKFPLKDYAALLGYDVLEHPTKNQEEAEQEKKRAAEVLKKARKSINQDLNLLFNFSYSWKEKIKGKEEDFKDIRIIGAKGIERGYIEAEITPSFANYILKHTTMTKYPQALLKIDGYHNNAYYLGLKIAEHWHIDKNQQKGTNDTLSIKTLLKCLNLPNIQKLREQEASWQQKIFEPFMQNLDYLKTKGFLDDYKLVKDKKEELTPQEREKAYKDYNLFESLYLKYEINEKYK